MSMEPTRLDLLRRTQREVCSDCADEVLMATGNRAEKCP